MSDKALHDLLVELHQELKHTNSVSSHDEQLLRHLEVYIKRLTRESVADKRDLNDQLEMAVLQLEAAHPALTNLMVHTISVLSNMGL